MSRKEIIICTERGKLENYSKLLVSSLRQNGGALKDLPIISYQPRKGREISSKTRKFFESQSIEHVSLELNRDFADYPLANKPLVCAHHERYSKADTLIFLDSDTLFFKEPKEFELPADADTILRPVGMKNIGASGPDDPNFNYWKNLYEYLGVSNYKYIRSVIDNRKILEYYNTGHIVSAKNTGLFQQWEENFRTIFSTDIRPKELFYLEQSIFGATVSQLDLRVQQFSSAYNYPVYFLENRKMLKDHPYRIPFEDIVSLHYHKAFEKSFKHELISKVFNTTLKGRETGKMVRQSGVFPPLSYRIWAKLMGKTSL